MPAPNPTPIYRFIHVDNLHICLRRGGLHAPNHTPDNGLVDKTIHNVDIQNRRRIYGIPCGPRGVIHDYISFYFGYLSPMMLQLKTGQVEGYDEGQEPLIYLVSTAQAVRNAGLGFVFSDGHGIAAFTDWFDDLANLDKVDWRMVYERYWADNPRTDMDRQRRKQAEFLIHRFCPWLLIQEIVVMNAVMRSRVHAIMAEFPAGLRRTIRIKRNWYYY
ncbi:MAG: DUF4433 domain-containing protein [Deltaproteobacteria bacterium]|nr:DUF4433 domain-containing protein [Deltaproteobacteria bacterium]